MTSGEGTPSSFSLRSIGPEPEGATPIEAEDLEGLIPLHVTTRANLNEVEYENILNALPWATRQARLLGPLGLLDYTFLFELHRRMFGDVWTWAGTQRRRETNIGGPPGQITEQVRYALDDARYWHENDTFSVDERAARIHLRLVSVHPFPNGNGRTTRLMADLYLESIGVSQFSWGRGGLSDKGKNRKEYIAALERAEVDNCASLVAFARS
jgi:Fic-DOC domain mobile mystery protein B